MNKLNILIEELCPNGVEYKKVKDTFKRIKGTPITAAKMKQIATPNGSIRIFAGGKTVIDANEEDIPNANITKVPAVLVQSRGVIDVVYYDKPFTFKNEMWAYTADNPIKVKFLYYVLKNNIQKFRDDAAGMGALPQISLPVTEEFIMPVPPLPIQQEIVQMLDSYTETTEKLVAELENELTARKKQYEYYRDTLLTFGVHRGGTFETKRRTLGEICDILTGYPFDSAQFKKSGVRLMRGMNIKRGGLVFDESIDRYWESSQGLEKYLLDAGDIVISMDGSLVGKSFGTVAKSDLPLLLVQRVARIRAVQANQRYVYHYISCKFPHYVELKKTKGAIPHISQKDIANFQIAIPDVEVQNKIAEVLDNFDAICSDLNIGLPAEIEARKKQYEYYRDMLLTFAAADDIILTDRQTDRQSLIKLLQYVFGYVKVPLKETANLFRGEYITKNSIARGNIPVILGGQEPAYYVDKANHTGEIVTVARSGVSAGFVGYWNAPIFVTDGFGYEARENVVISKYLYYVLKCKEKELNSMKRGAGVPHISGAMLGDVLVQLPAIEKQEQIVAILDRFDTLCNDLTTGLPAEIEARQKQYEYYRDKLLTFKELGA